MSKEKTSEYLSELIESLLIIELLKQGAAQLDIRELVGCDMHRISKIAKLLKNKK